MKGESKANNKKIRVTWVFRTQISYSDSVAIEFYDPEKLHLSFPHLSVLRVKWGAEIRLAMGTMLWRTLMSMIILRIKEFQIKFRK